jgi:hypothetical protein
MENAFSARAKCGLAIPVEVESLVKCCKQWQKFQALAIPFKFIEVGWMHVPKCLPGCYNNFAMAESGSGYSSRIESIALQP